MQICAWTSCLHHVQCIHHVRRVHHVCMQLLLLDKFFHVTYLMFLTGKIRNKLCIILQIKLLFFYLLYDNITRELGHTENIHSCRSMYCYIFCSMVNSFHKYGKFKKTLYNENFINLHTHTHNVYAKNIQIYWYLPI